MRKFMAIFLMLGLASFPLSAHKADQEPEKVGAQMQANGKRILPNSVISKGAKITFKVSSFNYEKNIQKLN